MSTKSLFYIADENLDVHFTFMEDLIKHVLEEDRDYFGGEHAYYEELKVPSGMTYRDLGIYTSLEDWYTDIGEE